MPYRRTRVTRPTKIPVPLPDWASRGVVTLLDVLGRLPAEELSKRLVLNRKKGSFSGYDLFVFFVYYFASGVQSGIRPFSEGAAPFATELAAVAKRRALATAASVSRGLDAVNLPAFRQAVPWMLNLGDGMDALLRHPAVLFRGAQGTGFHLFDLDKTMTVLMQRPLASGPELPPGERRSAALASVGVSGRKRGNVRIHRAALQHAGVGHWPWAALRSDNGGRWAELDAALAVMVDMMKRLDLPPSAAILRMDGEYGHVPAYARCRARGVRILTRLTRPEIFDDPAFRTRLCEGSWYEVPSDGSGPKRSAMELGNMVIPPGRRTVDDDDQPYDPVTERVVVSRYRRTSVAEHGVVLDGWQYELFVVDVDPAELPAEDAVALYFGRSSIENRFAQEDRELGLDRIFSHDIAGQEFASIVGLMLWNLQILSGFEQNPPPPIPPKKTPHRRTVDPRPVPESMRPVVPPPPTPLAGPEVLHAKARAKLPELNWIDRLSKRPGWRWDNEAKRLRCPANQPLRLSSVVPPSADGCGLTLAFKSEVGACEMCPLRSRCNSSPKLRQPKMTKVAVDPNWLSEPADERRHPRLLPAPYTNTRSPKPTHAVHVPLFQPATARRLARGEHRSRQVVVVVETAPLRELPHVLIAWDRRGLQHGRRTLEERRNHYAIDPRAVVTIQITGGLANLRDARQTPPERRAAS